jgi:hypothetical protein
VERIIPAQRICSKRWLHIAQWNRQIFQKKVLFGHCPIFYAASVGASLLAMNVNDNACFLNKRAALESIASNRASTGCSYISLRRGS